MAQPTIAAVPVQDGDRPPPAPRTLALDACGRDVKTLQENLKRLGISGEEPSGLFTRETENAVRELQGRIGGMLHDRGERVTILGRPSPVSREDQVEFFRNRAEFHPDDWTLLEALMRREGKEMAPWSNDGLLTCDKVAGGSARDAAASPLETGHPAHALYGAIRDRLPVGVPDETLVEVTLRAMQNGIDAPDKLGTVTMRDDRIFVAGVTPGFRASVGLEQPASPMAELNAQFAALSRAEPKAIEPLAPSHGARAP